MISSSTISAFASLQALNKKKMSAFLRRLYRTWVPQKLRVRMYPLTHPRFGFIKYSIQKMAKQRILSGPFEGMRFTFENPHLIKLLGTYELEVHPAIEKLREFHFTKIINIGAAEGYYTIGFARLCPEATVYAFESFLQKQNAISQLAKDNGVCSRVYVNGTCSMNDLVPLLTQPRSTLLICDIEGQEKELLRPDSIKGLDEAYILVELHDMYVDSCTKTIKDRFEKTHFIESFSTRHRTVDDFPLKSKTILNFATKQTVVDIMEERRPARQDFFLMVPKIASKLKQMQMSFSGRAGKIHD